jgi:hypothetical protein
MTGLEHYLLGVALGLGIINLLFRGSYSHSVPMIIREAYCDCRSLLRAGPSSLPPGKPRL